MCVTGLESVVSGLRIDVYDHVCRNIYMYIYISYTERSQGFVERSTLDYIGIYTRSLIGKIEYYVVI